MLRVEQPELCDHGYERSLCRDEQTPEVRELVDFAFRHAFEFAARCVGTLDVPDLNAAEEYAAWIARGAALTGELDSASHARELREWAEARRAARKEAPNA